MSRVGPIQEVARGAITHRDRANAQWRTAHAFAQTSDEMESVRHSPFPSRALASDVDGKPPYTCQLDAQPRDPPHPPDV